MNVFIGLQIFSIMCKQSKEDASYKLNPDFQKSAKNTDEKIIYLISGCAISLKNLTAMYHHFLHIKVNSATNRIANIKPFPSNDKYKASGQMLE